MRGFCLGSRITALSRQAAMQPDLDRAALPQGGFEPTAAYAGKFTKRCGACAAVIDSLWLAQSGRLLLLQVQGAVCQNDNSLCTQGSVPIGRKLPSAVISLGFPDCYLCDLRQRLPLAHQRK